MLSDRSQRYCNYIENCRKTIRQSPISMVHEDRNSIFYTHGTRVDCLYRLEVPPYFYKKLTLLRRQ